MKKSELRSCPFCQVEPARLVSACEAAIAIKDSYPITEGHTLVLPRSHVKSIFDLSSLEQGALWAFVAEIRLSLARKMSVDAFNIGINDGTAAGQTIEHAHIHLIPRRKGDVIDPRGGIRHIIPTKARYWEKE
jgi:diadenosine tetraphosphate (Ap4A) HIT family hydrolase